MTAWSRHGSTTSHRINIVSADVIEVAPPFDHGEITSLAAATVIFDLITLLTRRRQYAA